MLYLLLLAYNQEIGAWFMSTTHTWLSNTIFFIWEINLSAQ